MLALDALTIGDVVLLRTKPLKKFNWKNLINFKTHKVYKNLNQMWATSTQPHPFLFHHLPPRSPLSFKTLSNSFTNPHHQQQLQPPDSIPVQERQSQASPSTPAPRAQPNSEELRASHPRLHSLERPILCRIIHSELVDDGFDQDPFLSSKLIGVYLHFSSIENARNLFDKTSEKTIFVWNVLLRALTLSTVGKGALSLCREMGKLGMLLDSFTFSYTLKACVASSLSPAFANRTVREIHGYVSQRGFESWVHVATTLIDCYGKLGWVSCSRRVFDGLVERNVVTWRTTIACYANVRPFDALMLFQEMMVRDLDTIPNSVTLVNVLQACASLAALGRGKLLHAYVIRRGLD